MNKEIENEKAQPRAINKKKARRLAALVELIQQDIPLSKEQDRELSALFHELIRIAMDYEKAGKYFAHNFHVGSCLAHCCKCPSIKMPSKYMLLPFDFVALSAYGKDFHDGVGMETIRVCANTLRAEIAKKGSILRRMKGYGKIAQYDPDNALFLNIRQIDVLRVYVEGAPSAEMLLELWRRVVNWHSDITQVGFR